MKYIELKFHLRQVRTVPQKNSHGVYVEFGRHSKDEWLMASANKRFARPVDVARVLAAPRLEVTETLLVGQAGLENPLARHEGLYTSARRRRRPARPPRSVVPTKRAANRRRPAVAMSRVTPWSRKFPRSRSPRVRRDRARPYRTRTRGGQTQGLWRATGATPANEPLCRLARACPRALWAGLRPRCLRNRLTSPRRQWRRRA